MHFVVIVRSNETTEIAHQELTDCTPLSPLCCGPFGNQKLCAGMWSIFIQFKSPDSGASSPMFPAQSFDVSAIDSVFRRRRSVTTELSSQQGVMFKVSQTAAKYS